MLLKAEITEAIHRAMGEVRDGHHDAADAIVRILANRGPTRLLEVIKHTLIERVEVEAYEADEIAQEIVAEVNLVEGGA